MGKATVVKANNPSSTSIYVPRLAHSHKIKCNFNKNKTLRIPLPRGLSLLSLMCRILMTIIVHDGLLIGHGEAEHEKDQTSLNRPSPQITGCCLVNHMGCSPDLSSYGSLPGVRE